MFTQLTFKQYTLCCCIGIKSASNISVYLHVNTCSIYLTELPANMLQGERRNCSTGEKRVISSTTHISSFSHTAFHCLQHAMSTFHFSQEHKQIWNNPTGKKKSCSDQNLGYRQILSLSRWDFIWLSCQKKKIKINQHFLDICFSKEIDIDNFLDSGNTLNWKAEMKWLTDVNTWVCTSGIWQNSAPHQQGQYLGMVAEVCYTNLVPKNPEYVPTYCRANLWFPLKTGCDSYIFTHY